MNTLSQQYSQAGNNKVSSPFIPGKKREIKAGKDGYDHTTEHVQFVKIEQNAKEPEQLYRDSVCWKLGLTKRVSNNAGDEVNKNIEFTTSLIFNVPKNLTIEISALPELINSGYIFPEGVKIVDSTNKEEITINLLKLNDNMEDLIVPGNYLKMKIVNSVHGGFDEVRDKNMFNQFDQDPRMIQQMMMQQMIQNFNFHPQPSFKMSTQQQFGNTRVQPSTYGKRFSSGFM